MTQYGEKRLLDELLGNGFCLILKNPQDGDEIDRFKTELDAKVVVIGIDFDDTEGMLATFMGAATALLCRPDKYVFDAGDDVGQLCAALMQRLQAG